MPLSSEVVRQKPLGGLEVIELLVNDLRDLLGRDGMFAAHVGYGRLAWKIRVELQMDNISYPTHVASRSSQKTKEKEGVESFPLPEPKGKVRAKDLERSRRVESPNAARIENGLPITVQAVSQGKLVTHELKYEKEGLPSQPAPEDLDRSKEAQAALEARVQGGEEGE